MHIWGHPAEVSCEEEECSRIGVVAHGLRSRLTGPNWMDRHLVTIDIRIDEDDNVGSGDIESQLRCELRLRPHDHAGKVGCLDPRSYDAAGAVI